jgi:hypothetical protein
MQKSHLKVCARKVGTERSELKVKSEVIKWQKVGEKNVIYGRHSKPANICAVNENETRKYYSMTNGCSVRDQLLLRTTLLCIFLA